MKKVIIASILLIIALMGVLSGCTADDPGPVTIIGTPEVMVVDSDGDIITIDSQTRVLAAIEYEHYNIHEGRSFSCWYLQDVSDTGDKTIITFRTSDTDKWIHLTATASATVMAHFRMYEAPVVTDNTGAPLAVYNRDRNSATTSTIIDTSQAPDVANQATYFTEATMGDVVGGTELAHEHLGTGEGKKTLGGNTRGEQEWKLKQNTLYAFLLESVNDDDNTHIIILNWYEHTSLN